MKNKVVRIDVIIWQILITAIVLFLFICALRSIWLFPLFLMMAAFGGK